jgi:hypothetical protein
VSDPTKDPMLMAVIQFVEDMCAVTVAEATGHYNARVVNSMRDAAKSTFETAWNKNMQDGGP